MQEITDELFEAIDKSALKHFACVGLIATTWSALEFMLDLKSLELAGISDEIALSFTAQVIGPGRKVDAYMSIVRLRSGKKFLKKLEAFSQTTRTLAESRNRAVHDLWMFHEGVSSRFEVTAKKILRAQKIPVETIELGRLIGKILVHIDIFIELHNEILKWIETQKQQIEPLPDKDQ